MFSFGLTGYIALGAGAAAAASIGLNFIQANTIDTLEAEATVQKVELAACGAQLTNILEDLSDDRTIDNLSDDDLRFPPEHWLLDPAADRGE